MKNVVVLGGGTGTFTVLSGLKKYPVALSAVVSMADNGGSTGRLRDQLGVLPPGDIRQCLVALSESDDIMRELFNYRFTDGDLRGHAVGNLLISGLEKMTGDFEEAVATAEKILRVKGKVIPVTITATNLCAEYENGDIAHNEEEIDEPGEKDRGRIKRLFLDPQAMITNGAAQALLHADLIVLGPGDLYTSLGQCLVVKGVAEALRRTKAHIVYNMNLMSKEHQTTGMNALEHIKTMEMWLGANVIDEVIVNNAPLPHDLVEVYELQGEMAIEDNFPKNTSYKVVRGNFLSDTVAKKQNGDLLKRSLLRHDSEKIAKKLYEILEGVA